MLDQQKVAKMLKCCVAVMQHSRTQATSWRSSHNFTCSQFQVMKFISQVINTIWSHLKV